jgi:endonuclease/exonuclease/phosphatase family metal-dependent hydrolase
MSCDLLLLTEVSERVAIPGMKLYRTKGLVAPRRIWAAVASSKQLTALDDPHGATAMVEIDGLRACSSILPWRSCGTGDPWKGSTAAAVASIEAAAPAVWGGDWNDAMSGPEWSRSQGGRRFILDGLDRLGLQIPTASAPHRIDGLLSIDHIAIPMAWSVLNVDHHPALTSGARISDHDAYVVEVN